MIETVRKDLLPDGLDSYEVPIGHSLVANILHGASNCVNAALCDLNKTDSCGRSRLDPEWTTEEEYQEALRNMREKGLNV